MQMICSFKDISCGTDRDMVEATEKLPFKFRILTGIIIS